MANFKARLTGADLYTQKRWHVGGTDLGIPYRLENNSTGYLFGDTFTEAFPGAGPPSWRSPVMLRSNKHPKDGIVFDSAAGIAGDGHAPEILANKHNVSGVWTPLTEFSVIPNDGITVDGKQYMSFMSVNRWDPAPWRTGYASIATSQDGNFFSRLDSKDTDRAIWWNDAYNKSPYQMQSLAESDGYIYMISVRSGRQKGPMIMQRAKKENMLKKSAWEWVRDFPEKIYGEPSLRKLPDGAWAMSYLTFISSWIPWNNGWAIVTRTSNDPKDGWSPEKIQVTQKQESNLYGGFIHWQSTRGANNLHMIVSKWNKTNYHASHYVGEL